MAIKSKGTKLSIDISAVYTNIGDIIGGVSPTGTDVEVFETTDYDQAGAGKTYAPTGYVEPGDVPFQRFFDPVGTIDQTLTDKLTTPSEEAWRITWPDGAATEWDFQGILTQADIQTDKTNGLIMDCNIKVTGLISYPT